MADRFNVTIIIPHYNTPDLLEKLICSIPDKEDVQTIVIDDNSTKEVEKYEQVKKDYGFRVGFYQNDIGVQSAGACRNIGLDHAEGKWILFADADDYFLPGMYDIISKYFDSDNQLIIFCPTSVFLDTGALADRHLIDKERIEKYLADPTHENIVNVKRMKGPWSQMIRRQAVEENHVRFSLTKHHNDMYFVAVLHSLSKKTAITNEVIYCITRSKGSLTTKVTIEAFDCHMQEYIKCYKFCKSHCSKNDLRILNYNGGFLLYKAFVRHLGLMTIIKAALKLMLNGVPIITLRMINPKVIYRNVKYNNAVVKRERKYYV